MSTLPLALYCRVSTSQQSVDSQLDRLRQYAQARGATAIEFVDEGVSGARRSRPALDRMMAAAVRREISAVVITKLDRIGRSLANLAALAEELEALNVALVCLDQAIDSGTPAGKMMFGMLATVAAFERELARERTRDGLAAARRRGAKIGRPRSLKPSARRRLHRLRASGHSLRQCAELLSSTLGTVRREVVRRA